MSIVENNPNYNNDDNTEKNNKFNNVKNNYSKDEDGDVNVLA